MRNIEYLSPTSLSLFKQNQEEFYLRYLSDTRGMREPQTQPMSIGSAFDSFVKSYLYESLFGKGHDLKFDLKTLFEAQVESHNRTSAWNDGAYAFKQYKDSGALADLMLELEASIGTPRFEFEIKGVVNGFREGVTKTMLGVVFLGKPDIFFINRHGCHVIFDWKVNGFYSKYSVSPMAGYLRTRGYRSSGPHKDCIPSYHNGMQINGLMTLEFLNEDWASQLGIYGWLCGQQIGDDFIAAIDQLACSPSGPNIRVAEHRLRIGQTYQWKIFAEAQHVWEIVHSDHIFRELTFEESQARCLMLDKQAAAMDDPMFNKITRGY